MSLVPVRHEADDAHAGGDQEVVDLALVAVVRRHRRLSGKTEIVTAGSAKISISDRQHKRPSA